MRKFQELYDFVDRAIRSRKYPDNTGMSLKTALKLFEVELNEDERNSINEFRKNLEQVYQSVFAKNKHFSAGSLATYKSRVAKVLADYEKYGTDPTKMANWSPKMIRRSKKSITSTNPKYGSGADTHHDIGNSSFHTFDFVGGVKLLVPKTTKATDAIMDGELKQIKVELKRFSDAFCEGEVPDVSQDNNNEV